MFKIINIYFVACFQVFIWPTCGSARWDTDLLGKIGHVQKQPNTKSGRRTRDPPVIHHLILFIFSDPPFTALKMGIMICACSYFKILVKIRQYFVPKPHLLSLCVLSWVVVLSSLLSLPVPWWPHTSTFSTQVNLSIQHPEPRGSRNLLSCLDTPACSWTCLPLFFSPAIVLVQAGICCCQAP